MKYSLTLLLLIICNFIYTPLNAVVAVKHTDNIEQFQQTKKQRQSIHSSTKRKHRLKKFRLFKRKKE